MPAEEYVEPLTEGLFRERRVYLGPEAWGDPGNGIAAPTHLIGQDDWMQIMDLPTHVVLETTDHFGGAIRAMNAMSYKWICAIDPALLEAPDAPFVFDAYLDAHDEFEAAPFVAMHGWYRQGTASLRNALEVMTNAARYAVRGETEKYAAWRGGSVPPPRFGNSVELIAQAPSVASIEALLVSPALFGRQPAGVLTSLYEELSHFAHGNPGHTNAVAWGGSNGPVLAPDAFARFWRNFRDTFLACSILLKIAFPPVKQLSNLPIIAPNAGYPGSPWHGLAPTAVAAYFSDLSTPPGGG